MSPPSEGTGEATPLPGEVAPLPLPPDHPLVAAVRDAVARRPSQLRAGLLHLRRRGDATVAVVGLVPVLGASPDLDAIDRDIASSLPATEARPLLREVAPEELPWLLASAPPVGAGGRLEQAVVDALVAGDLPSTTIAVAAFADAVVWVPVAGAPEDPERTLAHGDEPRFPPLRTPDGSSAVAAFTSELSLGHADPPTLSALRVTGAVLAASVPPAVDIVLDPGSMPFVVPAATVRRLSGRRRAAHRDRSIPDDPSGRRRDPRSTGGRGPDSH